MKHFLIAVAFVLARPAFADEPARRTVQLALHQALEEKASLPATPPSLPDAASDQGSARQAILSGEKGDVVRAAHELAGKRAEAHAQRVQADVDPGAVNASKGANADRSAATAQNRSNEAKLQEEQGQSGNQDKDKDKDKDKGDAAPKGKHRP